MRDGFKQSCATAGGAALVALVSVLPIPSAAETPPKGAFQEPVTEAQSAIHTISGNLEAINRKAAWPRLEIQISSGEIWMLELPDTVTLAWLQGRAVDLDSLKKGQPLKVLFTKRGAKKKVRSVQLIGGVFAENSGTSDQGAAPPGAFPQVPRMPDAPKINIKVPELPSAQTTAAPELPNIPAIPAVELPRDPRR